MPKLQTIWVDVTLSVKESGLPAGFSRYCETLYCSEPGQIRQILASRPIDLICFDFDYPDRGGLRVLRETKIAYPSIPVLMLTVQHSESLAIWAFRAKVADYLVKPVPVTESERCLSVLARAWEHRQGQPARTVAARCEKIPEEISFLPKADSTKLAMAIAHVEQNFRSKIRSEKVARLCGLSPFRFSRVFRDTYGITFRDFLINYRLKEAGRLLENPASNIADVAFAVGFQDPSYFARVFKQRIGLSPSSMVGKRMAAVDAAGKLPVELLPKH